MEKYYSNVTGEAVSNGLSNINNIFSIAYPVGSIYMSINNVSPATLFGGTWEQIQDKFLLGAGSSYAAGSMGGEATHTLTLDEIPSHEGHMPGEVFNVNQGNLTKYLSSSTLSTYGSVPRGWDLRSGNEVFPVRYNTGGGAEHNNMPPYLVVYIWKRTA